MDETATQYTFVVARYVAKERAALHAGLEPEIAVDMEGYLLVVKALDGRALRLPKKRRVVLQGTTLTWYEDQGKDGAAPEQSSQSLQGASFTMPVRSTSYAMTPAMKAFADMRRCSVTLDWPSGSTKPNPIYKAQPEPEPEPLTGRSPTCAQVPLHAALAERPGEARACVRCVDDV